MKKKILILALIATLASCDLSQLGHYSELDQYIDLTNPPSINIGDNLYDLDYLNPYNVKSIGYSTDKYTEFYYNNHINYDEPLYIRKPNQMNLYSDTNGLIYKINIIYNLREKLARQDFQDYVENLLGEFDENNLSEFGYDEWFSFYVLRYQNNNTIIEYYQNKDNTREQDTLTIMYY